MHTYNRFLIIALALFSVMTVSAQRAKKKTSATSAAEKMTQSYTDSLSVLKMKMDSLMAASDSVRSAEGYKADDKTYQLFAPTTYYPSAIGNRMKMGGDTLSALDNALVDLYMKRPDLVVYAADKLAKNAKEPNKTTPTELEKVELTKQVEAKPKEEMMAESIPQENIDLIVTKPKFWKFNGDYYLQFMQNYVTENWYKSGSNNYSMLGAVTLNYNYNNKQKVKWDNKLELKLGFMTSESDTINKFKSTEDLIRYTSKFGLQAHKNWYYSAQLIVSTQFTKGRKDNSDKIYSDFMSPINLSLSVGMDYNIKCFNDRLTGNVHLAPMAYNMKYVDRLNLAKSFGIDEDHHVKNDFGSEVTADIVWKPWDFLKWQMRFYAFTTYHRFVLECENTIGFKFNKYISANLFLYPRFEDKNKREKDENFWMFKEYLSLGFSYSM